MILFHQTKDVIVELTDLSKDALHLHVSVLIFLGGCVVFGWRASTWKPWLLVLAFALLGELWDIQYSIADDDPLKPVGNLKDIINTMFVPSLLMLLARYTDTFVRKQEPLSGDET